MKALIPAIFVLLLFLSNCKSTMDGDVIFSNVHIVDVIEGRVIQGQDVFVEGDKIKRILPHGRFNLRADRLIDGTGKFLIPGLWDMHVHLWDMSETFFPLFMAYGVTGIREMHNNTIPNIKHWKDSVNNLDFAPRIGPMAGRVLDGVNSPFLMFVGGEHVSSAEEAREKVKEFQANGSDFIKILSLMSEEEVKVIANETRKMGVPFCGHFVWGMDLNKLSDLGIKSLEHLTDIAPFYSKNSEYYLKKYDSIKSPQVFNLSHFGEYDRDIVEAHRSLDLKKAEDLFNTLKKNQTWICTAVLAILKTDMLTQQELLEEKAGLQYFPDSLTNRFVARWSDVSREDSIHHVNIYNTAKEISKLLYDYDMPLIIGSHATKISPIVAGISIHTEMEVMQEAGIPAGDILKMATFNAALFLDREDELGSIQENKLADMVLLNSNPLDDTRNTKDILGVMKNGKYFDRAYIDNALEEVKEKTN